MTQKGQSYSKYWVFTINNPGNDQIPAEWDGLQYCVWQKEQGENGTVHLQGYSIWEKQKRLSALKKVHSTAHWETRKGTHEQAKAYSMKLETRVAGPFEFGEVPEAQQGKRQDLLAFKRKLEAGVSEKQLAESDETFPTWAKYGRIVQRFKVLCGQQRTWPTEVRVYIGPPGVGKSRRAFHEGGADAFWLPKPAGQTTWWDGYCGQEIVVIDEFYGWIARDLMCRICDRYPLNVETKGGSTPFLAKKLIITSNASPKDWWPKVGLGPMERRLSGSLGRVELMLTAWTEPVVAPQQWEALPVPQIGDATLDELRTYFDSLQCDEVLPEVGSITPQADCPVHADEPSEVCEQQEAEYQDAPRFYLTVSGDHWVNTT